MRRLSQLLVAAALATGAVLGNASAAPADSSTYQAAATTVKLTSSCSTKSGVHFDLGSTLVKVSGSKNKKNGNLDQVTVTSATKVRRIYYRTQKLNGTWTGYDSVLITEWDKLKSGKYRGGITFAPKLKDRRAVDLIASTRAVDSSPNNWCSGPAMTLYKPKKG